MFDKRHFLIFSFVLFLPIVTADLQPVFLDQDAYFLGEEINFGLIGVLPDDLNHVGFKIIMPNNYAYVEAIFNLDNLSDYYVVFPSDFTHPNVKAVYTYYNSNNTEILNQEFMLQFTKLSIMENIKYCINEECGSTTFEQLDANEIILGTQKKITDKSVSFDITVIQEGYVISNLANQDLPYSLSTISGNYEIVITPRYNNHKFEATRLSLYVYETEKEYQSLGDYIAKAKVQHEQFDLNYSNKPALTNIEIIQPEQKHTNIILFIIIGIIGVIIITFLLLNKKPKQDKKPKQEDKGNRRKSRNERGFIVFFIFLFCLSSIHTMSLDDKIKEYQNLEITFDNLQELYPHPDILPIPISNTQPKNIIYYPLSATGLSDLEKITPVLENNTKNMSVSLETVYFATNHVNLIETAKAKGEIIRLEAGCEQVFDWFYQNPITEDPSSVTKRTKENLLKEIKITDQKTTYTDFEKNQINNKTADLKKKPKYKNSENPMVDYCISEVLTKQKSILGEPYLYGKNILLKIQYEEKNQELITSGETTITDNIIFKNNKNKDVLENTFMGSDLSHIEIFVDFVNDILKEQNIVFEGITDDQMYIDEEFIDNEKTTYYLIPYLLEGQELTIKYTAQLLDLAIADSEYGYYYNYPGESGPVEDFGPEKKGYKFVILDKNISKIRNRLISNVELKIKVKLDNGNYEFLWDDQTLQLLAEVNLDPTKYILLDKKLQVLIGNNETNTITLGIDKDYGIISDSADLLILLDEDKTIYSPQTPNHLHLDVLQKLFLKTSTQKNIELIRLQLPFLFIFAFKKNAQTIIDDSELYLKTYDDLANLLNETQLTKIEKNIIFNNLISLTEDFCFQKPGNKLYWFSYKTRLVLNYGLIRHIDDPKDIASIEPKNIPVAIPYLYDNAYLERKGFVDKSLTKLLVLGYLGENYNSVTDTRKLNILQDTLEAHESKLKSQIQQMFVALKADSGNWGYYKQILLYPFYRTGFEQQTCASDADYFPKFASKNYCYFAYNINPGAQNFGTLYDPYDLQQGFLMDKWAYQNNYAAAYRTILLFEDIESFKNNELTFNQNQLRTFNKLNTFLSLIELEAIRKRGDENVSNFGTSIILSHKLKEIWNGPDNDLKEYYPSFGKQIDNLINDLTYKASAKLRGTIVSDKSLRFVAYDGLFRTAWDDYTEQINVQAEYFDGSDFGLFFITGGWFDFEKKVYKGDYKKLEKIKNADREKYDKLINGTCCIAQRLGELEGKSSLKNWTVDEIKGTFSPYSKSKSTTRNDKIGWVTDGVGCTGLTRATDCSKDIEYLYKSKEYGKDISIILNDTKDKKSTTSYLTSLYNERPEYYLDIDHAIQLNRTERELKTTVADLKHGIVGSILRFVDNGINPVSIGVAIVTGSAAAAFKIGAGSSFYTIVCKTKILFPSFKYFASTLGKRAIYEIGENILIDAALGALVFSSPEVVGEHQFLTTMVLALAVNKVTAPLYSVDNVARKVAMDIGDAVPGLKAADNIKIEKTVKAVLDSDFKDTTKQLIKIKKGIAVTDDFFLKLQKTFARIVDDDVVAAIQKGLKSQKISISDDIIRQSLQKNGSYFARNLENVSKFLKTTDTIKVKFNKIALANADETSSIYFKSVFDRTTPVRFGKTYASIVDEFEDLKRLYKIDPEHVVRPIELVYENGKPIGYSMEKVVGITLADYIESGGKLDDAFYEQLEEVFRKFHKEGVVHGDINPRNIIIVETYDGLSYKIIDPVGYGKIVDNIDNLDAVFNDDLVKIRNLKNYTTADSSLYHTNASIPKNTQQIKRMQRNGDLVPIIRSSGEINLAQIIDVSDDGTKINVRGIDPKTGDVYTRWTDVITETHAPILKGDIVSIDDIGTGRVINIEMDNVITIRLNNGGIRYVHVKDIINSRKATNYIKKYKHLSESNFDGFITTDKRLPEVFAYPGSSGWNSREVILVDKVNDPVLVELLQRVRQLAKNCVTDDEKLKLAFDIVDETLPTSVAHNIALNMKNIENLNTDGVIIPFGYFISNKVGNCKQQATLLKLILDEMGMPSTLRIGYIESSVINGRHLWVELTNPVAGYRTLDPFLATNHPGTPYKLSRDAYFTLYQLKTSDIPKENVFLKYLLDGEYKKSPVYKSIFGGSKSKQLDQSSSVFVKIQNLITNTFKKEGYGKFLDNFLIKEYKFKKSDIEQIMRLHNDFISDIYNNDDMLHVINNYISRKKYAAAHDDIVSLLNKRNITVEVVDDFVVQRSHGLKNYATLNLNNPNKPVIIIEKSAYNAPDQFLREMRHEYGAYLLIEKCGGRENVPVLIVPSENSYEPMWATHYLDHFIDRGFYKFFN